MSTNNSVPVTVAANKDMPLTLADLGTATPSHAVAKKTVATVVEVPAQGGGGFSAKATIGELVEFQLTGLLVVFVVLGGLTLVCNVIARMLKVIVPNQYFGTVATKPAVHVRQSAPSQPVAAAKTIHLGMSDDRLLAIISVAIAETLGQAATVVKFRHMDSMDWTWSIQGRVSIHNSHKL